MAEYIEREAVCYRLAKRATIDGQPRAIRRAAKIVADFPAADVVERKKGKWKYGDMPTYGGYKCSVCGGNTVHYKANFCPNCGADMRGEADET